MLFILPISLALPSRNPVSTTVDFDLTRTIVEQEVTVDAKHTVKGVKKGKGSQGILGRHRDAGGLSIFIESTTVDIKHKPDYRINASNRRAVMQDNTQFEKIIKKRKKNGYESTRKQAKAEEKERRERRAAKREIL